MKKLTTIVGLLISTVLFGQSDTTKSKKLLIGFSASPDMCYRTLENNDGSATSAMVVDIRNSYEIPKLGYSSGLLICYNAFKHVGFETGIQYSSKGEKLINSNLTYGDILDPRQGFYTQGATATKVIITSNYNYIDIPLRAIFTFGTKKVQFISSFGVTTNIFINATQKSIIEYENADTERKKQTQVYNNFKSVNISPTINIGFDYRFSKKMNLRVEPTFRYGLIKIIDTPVTAYLWSAGLNITCYYRIK
jgi:hypothetical protein